MEYPTDSIEEKIIVAGIKCIDRHGFAGATSRRIAAEAGVNGAAINYYFRSKDALLEKCLQRTMQNAFDWQDTEGLPENDPAGRLAKVILHLLQGACNYPGITRFYLNQLAEGRFRDQAMDRIGEMVDSLVADLRQHGASMDDGELHLEVAHVIATTMMLSLIPDMLRASHGLDMHDPDKRAVLVSHMVRNIR